ncbi:hypothetical protein PFFCH_03098 [Plasmodium falciparum FCH/4]|uniref:Uncharacterized protein n=1 Tax=Plasmodium falciparum FCH/4 TaxID=1036724 RepID=A0A024VNI8_PLAFA|nr:hypothetical protein PFFCH_03098 [Plasmodium falciparum FCH/4]
MMMFRPHNVIKNIINSDKKVFLSTINPLNKENKNVIDIYDNYEVLKNMKEKNTLKSSLKKFREIVKKETKRKGYNFYSGWPPVNRIKVTDDEKDITQLKSTTSEICMNLEENKECLYHLNAFEGEANFDIM